MKLNVMAFCRRMFSPSGGRHGGPTPADREQGGVQRPADVLILGMWCGLMTGFLALTTELASLLSTHFSSPAPLGLEAGWLNAPLADVALFGSLGLVIACLNYRWPTLISIRVAMFAFFFLGFLSLLFLIPRLNHYSSLVLAVGLAVQAVRLTALRTVRFMRLCRLTVPWLIVLALAVPSANAGAGWISKWVASSAPAPARKGAPNVLLIVLDTVRAQTLSVYGHPEPTSPWLERFAKGGVLFEHALSSAPWTLPTHATLFTGQMPGALSVNWDAALDATFPTIAEVFSDHGYLTAGFVANFRSAGARTGLARGFHRYRDHRALMALVGDPGRTLTSSTLGRLAPRSVKLRLFDLVYKDAADVSREFLEWLPQQPDRPVFAFLNYFDAHSPYRCPKTYDSRSGGPRQRRVGSYVNCIAYLDKQLGLLFEELRARGFLDNALVVITSDHGEHFGENGVVGHGNSLYRPVLEVPLLISFTGVIPGGTRVQDVISLRDVAATILDLSGIQPEPVAGQSLSRYWTHKTLGAAARSGPVLSQVTTAIRQPDWLNSDGPMVSVVENGLHYIKNFGKNKEELYDFANDPREERNLVDSPEAASWLPHLRSRIAPAATTFLEVSR